MKITSTLPQVTFFQRRPRKGFNFSLEYIFNDIRNRLVEKITYKTYLSKFYNDGYLFKLLNILEATFRQDGGINHITGEVHFLNLLMPKNKVLLTVLDCGMIQRKKGIERALINWLYLKLPVKKSKLITTISEETKNQIIAYTNCNPNKIKIIPVAINSMYQPFPKQFTSKSPVILQIGTGYNKNILRLVEAIKDIDCSLIIIGRLSDEQLNKLKQNKINYSNAYNLTEEQLLQKYYECDIVSFVSTFEGFGMPILEGNAVERVVVTSNVSSMVEVAGDAACLVDPFDVESIRNGFKKVIENELFRNLLIDRGRKNKERYDANKIAGMYYEIYKDMHSS